MTFYDLNNLVDYNYWARDRVLDAVSALTPEQFTCDLGNSFSSVRDTIAHICDAEYIWVTRWRGGQPIGFQKAERIADVASARAVRDTNLKTVGNKKPGICARMVTICSLSLAK